VLRAVGIRLLNLVPVLLVVSFGTSLLLELVPGDPVISALGDAATEDNYARARHDMGLDKGVLHRYFDWVGHALTGDLGHSLINPGQSVGKLIGDALPVTIEIALLALLFALLLAVPSGVWAAHREGSRFDSVSGGVAAGVISIPPFLLALFLIFFFVVHQSAVRYAFLVVGGLVALRAAWSACVPSDPVRRGVEVDGRRLMGAAVIAAIVVVVWAFWPHFPRIGFVRLTAGRGLHENLRSAFLPALSLGLTEFAVFSRLLRSDMVAVLQEDYITAARAKGMPTRRILLRDALRPSSFSLLTLAGVSLGRLIGGSIIIEQVFAIQGVGRLVVGNITAHDYPIVQGGVLVIATAYVLINTLIDVSYSFIDPRIRRGRA
jgi:peptide/nickel transport system permease protein